MQTTAAENNAKLCDHAWFKAREGLVASKPICSFVRLYAVFVFHLLALPEDPVARRLEDGPDQLLDHALGQMKALVTEVEKYCLHLKIESAYRSLLDSCVRIIKWHGYVRDTLASLQSDRLCALEDITWKALSKIRLHISLATQLNRDYRLTSRPIDSQYARHGRI